MKRPCAVDPQISGLSDLPATLLNNDATGRRIHDGNTTAVTIERAESLREITEERACVRAGRDSAHAPTLALGARAQDLIQEAVGAEQD
jgi:hypothetical protein